MALKLAGRNPAKFEFDDGVSQTTVTITPDDPPHVVAAKLRRVLELEGELSPVMSLNNPNFPMGQMPQFTPADRAATEERLAKAEAMGWESTDVGTLPEA